MLQIATSYPVNEADPTAPFIRSIARALAADGHTLQIIVPHRMGMPDSTTEAGVTVHWVRYAPTPALNVIGHGRSLQNDARLRGSSYAALPFFIGAAFARASAITLKWKPAVVQSHWALPSGVVGAAIAKACGARHIVSLHGSDIYVANSRRSFQQAAGFVFRSADQVTACSPYLAEQAIRLGANPERVHFLPYGVDPALFPERERGASNQHAPIVLAAGRLVEKKGFRKLIEQADLFLTARADAELWIAGDGDDRQTLENAVSAKHSDVARRIKLLGRVEWSRMPELFRRASVFVMPSISDSRGNQDGLPNVILEAMSSGAAVVATDIGGAEAVIDDGVTGIIVPANAGPRLGEAIAELLSNPEMREGIGLAASERIRSQHTWQIMARKLGELFVG